MKPVSPNTAMTVLVMVFITLGAARIAANLGDGRPLEVGLRASISHPVLLAGTMQTAFIKVDLRGFGIETERERTPVNVAFVLDKSGSMGGEKMEQAIDATVMAVDYLKTGDVVSVIAYDNYARVLVPATEVSDKQSIKDQIRSLVAGGGTALYAGVQLGANQIREFLDPTRVNRVILLSDGQANEGPSSPAELGLLGATLVREGISVTTIGLGLGYNEDLMTQLALRSDGNHSFVEHVENLAAIFNQEFGDVLSVVAQDVRVTIECGEGVRPVRVLGRPAEIEDHRVTVTLNQLYSEQEKYIMVEVEASPDPVASNMAIADVVMSYTNMVTSEPEDKHASISASVTHSEEAVAEHVAPEPMSAAIEQQGILNEEKAIALRDEGKVEEAEQILKENAAYYEAGAALYGDDGLRESALRSRQAIDNLDADRWNEQRKAMRADHYKGKTQQGGN